MRAFWTVTRYARAARFWIVIALIVAGFFGCNEARAQNGVEPCTSGTSTCNREQAYAACMAHIPLAEAWYQQNTNDELRDGECIHSGGDTTGSYQAQAQVYRRSNGTYQGGYYSYSFLHNGCPQGTIWNPLTGLCGEDCSQKPTRHADIAGPVINGSTSCENGCTGVWYKNDSGSGFNVIFGGGLQCKPAPYPNGCEAAQLAAGWRNSTTVAGVCTPPTSSCPDGSARDPATGECGNDACPAGMVLNPQGQCEPEGDTCPAGQTRAPDGSCQNDNNNCPAGQVKGPDGTCKPDSDGDGDADPDPENTFSGGDTCETPPTCAGDEIMCGQARIQWRIECNTRKDMKVNGGACNAVPQCVGRNCDALQYRMLLAQWKSSCLLEEIAENGLGAGGDDDSTAEYDPTVDAAAVVEVTAGEGDPADAFTDQSENNDGAGGVPGGTGELDTTGLGYGTACPSLPSITVFGNTLDFQAAIGAKMCDWFRLAGQIVLILAALLSVRIIAGGGNV